MTGDDLATLLHEANRDAWESLTSALGMADGQPSPRVGRLVQHLSVTKRGYWEALASALGTPAVPGELNLDGVCDWEEALARTLSPAQLAVHVRYSERDLDAAALLRLNARHTVWHAGQIAALSRAPRLA
ncbi:hypothetical protein [Deinococcus aquiradiocola]|uniref:Uncharacterized protein n=1 Tax=Deinococcus aquiradiocola TaxID=393059 RepID=A0A917PFM3_9DEIO|nr:hypothetical protein [Deinococcus aquiradiocola]GGJ74448.1 hypothetical protein GCM10008939_18460 [Deinococcus aquiradiocola]